MRRNPTDMILLLWFWLSIVSVVWWLLDWHMKFTLISARQEYLNLRKNFAQMTILQYYILHFWMINA